MSALPDHLRHAKHVGKLHLECAVCVAKADVRALLRALGAAYFKVLKRPPC